ncbi:hypothetical protein IT072_04700 [Leifsonia sp. ZF2019]|uniref:hypothetical protein n=1 Tax=Leifsonia sp. ZF2019 TaxID=2781978 RepID=UPI001CBD7B77|nr:hypothetical protein [Leifsonia sp. ZF2019]UAJ80342.1 hypothetical protein IT072_04700 [Leifsonia sp. ZF2019]
MTDAREQFPETPSGEPIDVDAIAEGGGSGPYDADGVFEPEHDETADDDALRDDADDGGLRRD